MYYHKLFAIETNNIMKNVILRVLINLSPAHFHSMILTH